MKTDRKDMITTQYSGTIAELRIIPTYYNMPILTIALLQYKWLKPQYQAKHYHTCQQVIQASQMMFLKGNQTINTIKSKIDRQTFRKYYNMDNIKINFKKTICSSLVRNNYNHIPIFIHNILNKRQQKINELSRYKQRLSPNLTHKINQIQSPIIKKAGLIKNGYKSPALAKKSDRDIHVKKSNNILGKDNYKINSGEQDYGLTSCNSNNGKSKLKLSERQSEKQARNGKQQLKINQCIIKQQLNQYFGTHYQNIQNDLRLKSMTPIKQIKTFRKVLSKQSIGIKPCKIKTEPSGEKLKTNFNKKYMN